MCNIVNREALLHVNIVIMWMKYIFEPKTKSLQNILAFPRQLSFIGHSTI